MAAIGLITQDTLAGTNVTNTCTTAQCQTQYEILKSRSMRLVRPCTALECRCLCKKSKLFVTSGLCSIETPVVVSGFLARIGEILTKLRWLYAVQYAVMYTIFCFHWSFQSVCFNLNTLIVCSVPAGPELYWLGGCVIVGLLD